MDRSVLQLFRALRPAPSLLRGHKTTARTKRALKIAPHDSFLPARDAAPSAQTPSIIYNPPAAEPSPAHTPRLFLPWTDPRRELTGAKRQHHQQAQEQEQDQEHLPPAMRYKRRQPRYHLEREHIDEMRRLRAEDPLRWSVGHLAARFDCSTVFVRMAAPASAEHLAWLRGVMDRKMERWGPIRRQAREDRKRRAEMLYRGEL